MPPLMGIVIAILLVIGSFLIAAIYRATLNLILDRGDNNGGEGLVACSLKLLQHNKTEHHDLTQRVINLFEQQRQEKHQFAVLFLSSQDYITDVTFQTKTGPVYIPEEATNSSEPIFPPDYDLHNFVTARPHRKWYAYRKRHAEEQLLDKFDLLKTSFESSGFNTCRTAVLFTWLLPCKNCTTRIINKLGGRGLKVIVIYIIKHRNDTVRNESYTVERLENANIDVIPELCDHYVQSL